MVLFMHWVVSPKVKMENGSIYIAFMSYIFRPLL